MSESASRAVAPWRSREQQYAEGKAIPAACRRESHAKWKAPADRADPVKILEVITSIKSTLDLGR
jgi:hypothetical protein